MKHIRPPIVFTVMVFFFALVLVPAVFASTAILGCSALVSVDTDNGTYLTITNGARPAGVTDFNLGTAADLATATTRHSVWRSYQSLPSNEKSRTYMTTMKNAFLVPRRATLPLVT